MILSYFFPNPLKKQFISHMKALNDYFFLKLMKKDDLKECSSLAPHLIPQYKDELGYGYTDPELKDFCRRVMKPSKNEAKYENVLYKNTIEIIDKLKTLIDLDPKETTILLSTKYNDFWHIDSNHKSKIPEHAQFIFSTTIVSDESTIFVKEGKENFETTETNQFCPPLDNKFTTERAKPGEAAISLSKNPFEGIAGALHTAPPLKDDSPARLTVLIVSTVNLNKLNPGIVNAIASLAHEDHPTLDITKGFQAPDIDSATENNPTYVKAQFADGLLLSKIVIAPVLEYTSQRIQGDDTNKSFTTYYQEKLPEIAFSIAKSFLFFAASVYNPMSKVYGQANIQIVNKISSDVVFNLITFQANKIYDMVSADYAKELSFFALPSLHSMLGGDTLVDINQILENHPFASGVLTGAGAEIINLAGALGNKAYGLVYPSEELIDF